MSKIDISQSRFKDYLPPCAKCVHFRPNATLDPFDTDSKCALFGDIPQSYLLMTEICEKQDVDPDKAFLDVGNRPPTMLERWAWDDAQFSEIADAKKKFGKKE